MQSFDVRFCKEYAVVYLIKIYLLIPKILHLNCKAIILKIIVKKKTPKQRKIAIIERESERIRDRDSCWIYNILQIFFYSRAPYMYLHLRYHHGNVGFIILQIVIFRVLRTSTSAISILTKQNCFCKILFLYDVHKKR